eukprot:3701235-Ditylum_brightwellii.AAC.1
MNHLETANDQQKETKLDVQLAVISWLEPTNVQQKKISMVFCLEMTDQLEPRNEKQKETWMDFSLEVMDQLGTTNEQQRETQKIITRIEMKENWKTTLKAATMTALVVVIVTNDGMEKYGITDHSGNECTVNLCKMSGILQCGLQKACDMKRLNEVWFAWSFKVNFVYMPGRCGKLDFQQ